MKLKKLAAKISSLILIALSCSCIKVFAEGHLYGTCLKGMEVDMEGYGTEIIITEVDRNLIANSRDKNSYNRTVKSHLNLIRERCKKHIFQITFEGIKYTMVPGTGELEISGMTGCSKEANRAVLNVLSSMPIFDAKTQTVRIYSLEKGWHNVTQYDYGTTSPKETLQKVTIRGDIRIIPERFLMLYRPGNDDNCDSINGIHPQIIDLSGSAVEQIGSEAFYITGIQKIILPEHPIHIVSRYEGVIGYERDIEIENAEYARYKTPNLYGGSDESCCIIA